jgi:hypothetical protein
MDSRDLLCRKEQSRIQTERLSADPRCVVRTTPHAEDADKRLSGLPRTALLYLDDTTAVHDVFRTEDEIGQPTAVVVDLSLSGNEQLGRRCASGAASLQECDRQRKNHRDQRPRAEDWVFAIHAGQEALPIKRSSMLGKGTGLDVSGRDAAAQRLVLAGNPTHWTLSEGRSMETDPGQPPGWAVPVALEPMQTCKRLGHLAGKRPVRRRRAPRAARRSARRSRSARAPCPTRACRRAPRSCGRSTW